MKKNLLLFFLSFCICTYVQAQRLYLDGYVVTNAGDTLKGKIDNKKWVQTPQLIRFSSPVLGEIDYKTDDIQGFGVTDEVVFVRKKTDLDVSPYALSKLLTTSERIIVKDTTLLLRQIVKGRLSLFYTKDKQEKNHYFIQKLNEPVVELVDHHFLKMIDGRQFNAHWDLYNQQLLQLCQDCSLYEGKAFKYSFDESTLTSLILAYNRFFGDNKPVIASKKEKFKLNFCVKAGLSSYAYQVDIHDYYATRFEKSGLTAYSIGGELFTELPSFRRKFSFSLDVLYNVYKEGVALNASYLPMANKSYLGFYFTPAYSLYKNIPKQLDMFVEAGASIEVPLNKRNINFFEEGMSTMYGYVVGVGCRAKNIGVALNYYTNNAGLQEFLMIGGNINRWGLNVSYALGK